MRQSGYNYNRYGDSLARKKRRRFFLILSAGILGAVLLAAAILYALFYSPWMKMTDVTINGLETVDGKEILNLTEMLKSEPLLGIRALKPRSNILFFNDLILGRKIKDEFAVIKEVETKKEFPHKLIITVKERKPMGTWCTGTTCRYFDDSGVLWGNALRSSGSLLLNIEDLRTSYELPKTLDNTYFESIKKIVSNLELRGFKINKIEIPTEGIGDIKVHTFLGYYILFNNDSDIPNQVEILKILLDQKGPDLKPQYIDLRIDGRIYYK